MVENKHHYLIFSYLILQNILPKLAGFVNSEDGNLRMLSFKLFSDIGTLYLDGELEEATHRLDAVQSGKLLDQVGDSMTL